MNHGRPIRVLLVDDHAIVREGYRRLLERENALQVIGEAATAAQASALVASESPDIVILDVTLGASSGLELLPQLLAARPTARVIVFSMHEEAIFATRALRAGAHGYVTKSSDPQELLRAVHDVAAGQRYLSPDIARELALASVGTIAEPAQELLSERERQLLRLLSDGRSTKEIAHLLELSTKTVANTQSALRRKLGANTSLRLLQRARTLGLLP